MTSYVAADLRRFVESRANHLCEYCLIHEDDTYLGCQVDRVIAEKHGGSTNADNLGYACTFCNQMMQNKAVNASGYVFGAASLKLLERYSVARRGS